MRHRVVELTEQPCSLLPIELDGASPAPDGEKKRTASGP